MPDSVGVVLAAGMGTRLGSDQPKWLTKVAGTTVARRQLEAMMPLLSELVVVAGYRPEDIQTYVVRAQQDRRNKTISVIENQHFRDRNNWYSALLGVSHYEASLSPGASVVVINSDLFASGEWFAKSIDRLLQSSAPIVIGCDSRVPLSDEAMRVVTDSAKVPGRVLRIGKRLSVESQAEYVGLLAMSKEGLGALLGALRGFEDLPGHSDSWYEEALQVLVDGGFEVSAVPVLDSRWVEIDHKVDLTKAFLLEGRNETSDAT